MTRALPGPVARYLVLGPTLALSVVLSSFGYPPLPRLAASLGLGALLIMLVAYFQRRRAAGQFPLQSTR